MLYYIIVDTMGYPIVVVVHAANVHDSQGAKRVLDALGLIVKTIQKIWADTAYQGEELAQWAKEKLGCVVEVVKKRKAKDFRWYRGDGLSKELLVGSVGIAG